MDVVLCPFGPVPRSCPQNIRDERCPAVGEAQFEKGVLTVRFPKTESKTTAKTINVK